MVAEGIGVRGDIASERQHSQTRGDRGSLPGRIDAEIHTRDRVVKAGEVNGAGAAQVQCSRVRQHIAGAATKNTRTDTRATRVGIQRVGDRQCPSTGLGEPSESAADHPVELRGAIDRDRVCSSSKVHPSTEGQHARIRRVPKTCRATGGEGDRVENRSGRGAIR